MKTFVGQRDPDANTRVRITVVEEDKEFILDPKRSQAVYNHSPGDFGYSGSGPSQLALAILLEITNNDSLSLMLYQRFKADVVSGFEDTWILSEQHIRQWINKNRIHY